MCEDDDDGDDDDEDDDEMEISKPGKPGKQASKASMQAGKQGVQGLQELSSEMSEGIPAQLHSWSGYHPGSCQCFRIRPKTLCPPMSGIALFSIAIYTSRFWRSLRPERWSRSCSRKWIEKRRVGIGVGDA